MVNTLGTSIAIMLNGTELCRLQHHSIVAPPKLEVENIISLNELKSTGFCIFFRKISILLFSPAVSGTFLDHYN